MTIWRLVTFHYAPQAEAVAQASKRAGVIGIGHKNIGDLNNLRFSNASELTRIIADNHPESSPNNCVNGGRSLWRFYREMQVGDLVILSAGGGKRVATMRVTGDYFFLDDNLPPYYEHRRKAEAVPVNPDRLWEISGRAAEGEGARRSLIRCANTITEAELKKLIR